MWHIAECTRGRETACVRVLRRLGYPDAWYPVKEANAVSGGKRRALRQAGRAAPMETVERAWVPGYLFIPTEEISCHIINGHHGQLWFRVLAPGGTPYRVKDEDMARMRDVPSRVKDLVDEAKRQEYEAWQAVRPVIGEIARVTRGTFAGTRGVVKAIHGGEVAIDTNGPIKAIKVPESIAERVT